MLTAGLLLVGGALAGFWGAGMPSLARVWNARFPDKLLMIADRRRAWWWANVLFLVAITTTAGGLSALAALIREAGSWGPAHAGMGLLLVGTALWAVDLTFRLVVTTSVADEVKKGGAVPAWYLLANRWSWSLLIAYMLCASASLIGFGLGLVRSNLLTQWSGWVAIAAGTLFMVGTIIWMYPIPMLIQLVTLLFGVLLLVS